MKIRINNENLENKGIDSKYFAFFQVWKELTDFRTFDSYQYRVMNSSAAINELVDVLNYTIGGVYKGTNHINVCKKETMQIIKEDIILKNYYYEHWKLLLSRMSQKTETEESQKALLYSLAYIYNEIFEDYLEKAMLELENCIERNEVEAVVKCSDIIVSNCITNGWSANALYKLIDIMEGPETNNEKWNNFKEQLLNRELKEYHVAIPLTIKIKSNNSTHEEVMENLKKQIDRMSMGWKTSDNVREEYPFINNIKKDTIFIDITVSSFDHYVASQKALSKYADILNIFSFNNLIEPWSIKDMSWYIIDENLQDSVTMTPDNLYGTHTYLYGANKLLNESIKMSNSDDQLKERLRATYSYVNMSKATYSVEQKYMNLWIALESLCRLDSTKKIISNVSSVVPSIMCSRYIYKKGINFVEDCLRCKIDFEFSGKTYKMNKNDKELMINNIFEIMNSDQLYEELEEKCEINDLLKFRCNEIRGIISDTHTMIDNIKRHYNNVKRQIMRLYRRRNAIVHMAGLDDTQHIRFIEHLESYLYEVVAWILIVKEKKGTSDINVIFESIKDNYQIFLDLSKKDDIIIKERLSSSGIIDFV